jgi:hypothetical protein
MTSTSPPPKLITSAGDADVAAGDAGWSKISRELLTSSRLVVLAGSGCSFGLTGSTKSAPMMADLFTLTTRLSGYSELIRSNPQLENYTNVEELLSAVQAAASLQSHAGIEEEFLRDATATIRDACDFIDESSDLTAHETFLRKIAHRELRQDRVSLFTTNYDLAFETALQRLRFTAIDGFGYGSRAIFSGDNFAFDLVRRGPRGELELVPEVIRLMKLHGSVDWDDSSSYIQRTANPTSPVLIYPSSNKYRQSFRQPYLEAMARFQASLREQDTTIIIIGFGFSDDHITQPIVDALLTQATMRLLVVSPDVSTSSSATNVRLRQAVIAGDNRITLLASTFYQFANLLPSTSGPDQWQNTQDALSRIWSTP